ncbi:PAS domain S-box protein [Desulfobacter hydrogenophilus]|nr:transporter substrate-binding domain-containing protein [Desulfobacter hydrogenophilus]NDY70625.1 transporter substrate-binding domain-containing protein [Desulfobacter hydrogenophilus]
MERTDSSQVVAIVLEDWPLQYSIDKETGQPEGFAIDILDKVAELSDMDIHYINVQTWAEANRQAEKFETIIFPNCGISDERLKKYDFTTPYETASLGVFFRKTTPCVNSMAGLSGKKIGAVETNIGVDFIKKKINADVTLQVYPSLEEMIMALLSGTVDAIVYPSEHVLNVVRRSGLEGKIKNCFGPIMEVKRAIAITKGNPVLLEKLETGLQQLMTSDEFKIIYEKWFATPGSFWTAKRFLTFAGIFAGFVVLTGLWWRHRMIVKSDQVKTEIIARLKQVEKARARSEALHQNLIDTIPDLIWLKDLNGVYLSCNQMFEQFFGAKESEIIGRKDYDFIDKDLADFFRHYDNKALKLEKPSRNEEILTFASNGDTGIFETIRAPMYDNDGDLIGVFGIARDISKRKKVEYGLEKNKKRLMSAQRIGRLGNWEYDISTNRIWASEQAKRIYGFDPACDNFTLDEIEACIIEWERVHKALTDLIQYDKPYDIEFEINPANGDLPVRTIKSTAELLRDDNGQPRKVVGVIQDISKWKKAETEKNKLTNQLRQAQKMEAIGTLAGGIAHDFNNILAAIIGFCELAFYDVEDGSNIQNDLKEIYAAGHRAKDLVKQILAFSRQSGGEIVPVQVKSIMKEIVSLLKASIPSSIEIKPFIESKSFIKGNPTQIHQVILNLCTNAAYAMEKNGGVLMLSLKDVEIKAPLNVNPLYEIPPGKYLEIVVSDTGEGIMPDAMDSIFEPYFTTKPHDEGTGLGLALVHGIVYSCGGAVTVSSEVGKGSIFRVLFPIIEIKKPQLTDGIEELPTGTERILFVDDEISITRMVERALKQLGYSIMVQTSSLTALEIFQAGPDAFDMVITDTTMPKMSGEKLAMMLLKIRPELPIIICTGFSKNISKQKALNEGIRAFLDKPVNTTDLAKTIRKVFDEAKTNS